MKDKYPEYKRRNNITNNHIYHFKRRNKIVLVDSSMVVPYNSFFKLKYKCHINIECFASVQSIKFIFDYIHKGGDKACCRIKKNEVNEENEEIYDEIIQYIDGRYLSPMEAAWRLQKFPLCGRSHKVERLSVHTENQQKIIFHENNVAGALNKWETTLTAWFNLNKKDDFAKKIKYANIPQYYTFENKKWEKQLKIRKHIAIGRLNVVSVGYCEYFAFYTYEHTHETQIAHDTCKFKFLLPTLYVSGKLRRAAASDALLSLVLSSLVRRPSNISRMARAAP